MKARKLTYRSIHHRYFDKWVTTARAQKRLNACAAEGARAGHTSARRPRTRARLPRPHATAVYNYIVTGMNGHRGPSTY